MSLPFGQGTARPLDVRPRPGVPAIEEEHAGPDVYRLLVAPGEVVIESREEELLDTRIAIANGRQFQTVVVVSASGIGHQIVWTQGASARGTGGL